MATEEHRSSTRRRYRLVAGALLIWVVVVMAAAGTNAQDSFLGVERLEILWVIGLGLTALFGLMMLIVLNPFHGEWVAPERERSYAAWIVPLLLLALVVWKPEILPELNPEEADESSLATAVEDDQIEAEDGPETVAQLSDLLLMVAAAASLGAAVFLSRRATPIDEEPDDRRSTVELEAGLAVALDELTTELHQGTDARSSVLAAYAVLESVLAEHGSKRANAETPTEHVQRSLSGLRIDPAPMVQLGELYELARFSEHPIDHADQRRALQALAQARAELAGLT